MRPIPDRPESFKVNFMILSAKRQTRSIDYLLATLSPLSVAAAVRRYLSSQPADVLRSIMIKVADRVDDDERALLDLPSLSPERFVDVVARNPRMLGAFDGPDSRAMLLSAIAQDQEATLTRANLRAALPPYSPAEVAAGIGSALRRGVVTTRNAAMRVCAGSTRRCAECGTILGRQLLATSRPLGEYGNRAFRAAGRYAPVLLLASAVGALIIILLPYLGNMLFIRAQNGELAYRNHTFRVAERSAAAVSYARISRRLRVRIDARLHVRAKDKPKPHVRVALRPHVSGARPFPAPRAAWRSALPSHAVAVISIPPGEPRMVQRARLIVSSYLVALMRRNDRAALGNLGLGRRAAASNLTEASVLARARAFRIVAAALQKHGKAAKIDVDIRGAGREYFGYYVVSENGGAAWITQHEVIPVPR
jgi:hypothetical protein